MRKILLPILILGYLLGCVRDQFYDSESDTSRHNHIENNPTSNNVIGSWVVLYYENLENGSVTSKNDVSSMGGMDVELKFMNDGTFCGYNTTNEIAGHYILRDFTIKIDVYGGTKVGQPEWGDMFSDIVYSVESFRRTNSELRLYYNNNKNCVVLSPKRRGIECAWTYSDI